LHFLGRILRFFRWRGRWKKIEESALIDLRENKPRRLLTHKVLHSLRRKPVEEIVEPCPGIEAVLIYLKSQNIRCGLFSNGLGKGYGHDILEKFNLLQFFDATLFREDVTHAKPSAEPILRIINKVQPNLGETDIIWCVGDRHKDVTACLAAQSHLQNSIQPLSYGLNAAVALLKKGIHTDHILISYEDMLEKLQNLIKTGKAL
jgi:phosphoglycolate phosphatase